MRNRRLSLLRVIACFGIVLLHTANVSTLLYGDRVTAGENAFSMGIVYCLMWAVPCFLLVSGALLLDPARSIPVERLFSRYVRRVFLALLICCVGFRLFDLLMDGEPFSWMFLPDGVWRMFTGKSWAHLWYLYLLIGLYLLLPFYRMIVAHSSERQLRYLLAVWFVFLSILPMFALFDMEIAFTISTAGIYPFYFFAGYAVYTGKLRVGRTWSLVCLFASTAAILALDLLRYGAGAALAESLDGVLGSYASPLVAVQSVALFALLCGGRGEMMQEGELKAEVREAAEAAETTGVVDVAREPLSWATELLELFDACGFGIYLIHMVFLRLFLRYMEWNPYLLGGWSFFALAVGVFLLSCFVVAILRRLPFAKEVL